MFTFATIIYIFSSIYFVFSHSFPSFFLLHSSSLLLFPSLFCKLGALARCRISLFGKGWCLFLYSFVYFFFVCNKNLLDYLSRNTFNLEALCIHLMHSQHYPLPLFTHPSLVVLRWMLTYLINFINPPSLENINQELVLFTGWITLSSMPCFLLGNDALALVSCLQILAQSLDGR